MSNGTWEAKFGDDAVVHVTETDWHVTGAKASEIEGIVAHAAKHGWPNLPGWSIDTSPGWDPEWVFLRLCAIGATEVVGPFPQEAERDALVDDDDIVVG